MADESFVPEAKPEAPKGAPERAAADVAAEIVEDLQIMLDRRSINAEMRSRVMGLQAKYEQFC